MAGMKNTLRRALCGRSEGLTLVEIVIAIALIAIIGVAFLGGLSNAMWSLHIADVRTTAESLARSEMEVVKESLYAPYYAPDDPDRVPQPYVKANALSAVYEGYYVCVTAFPIDPNTNELIVDEYGGFLEGYTKDLGIQQITVVVTHHERGEIVTLVGYKTERL